MRWARRLSSNRLNRMIVLSACLMCSLIPASLHAETRVALLWKARALQAAETIQKLRVQVEAMPLEQRKNSTMQKKFVCKMLLEFAYATHAMKDLEHTVHKIDKGKHAFHLAINAGKGEVFDFVYVYDQMDQLIGARLDLLPKGWSAIFMLTSMQAVNVRAFDEGCLFSFDLDDPFDSKAFVLD